TLLAVYQARHIKIIIDMNATLPQSHPYIATTNRIERIFGSKYVVVIGISPKSGDIYQPAVLTKVRNISTALLGAKGIVTQNLFSLSARRAKNIAGNADGLVVKPLMEQVPTSSAQLQALRDAVANNPVYQRGVVSSDAKTTAIFAEFTEPPLGFRSITDQVEKIVAPERDSTVTISVGGGPSYLAGLEVYSERMGILLPVAILIL